MKGIFNANTFIFNYEKKVSKRQKQVGRVQVNGIDKVYDKPYPPVLQKGKQMSRYIDADEAITMIALQMPFIIQGFEDNKRTAQRIIGSLPSIDLADYVPKDFHDKTCEAMAKRHQEEIDSMPTVVFCKDCRDCAEHGGHANCNGYLYCRQRCRVVNEDDYCAWGKGK